MKRSSLVGAATVFAAACVLGCNKPAATSQSQQSGGSGENKPIAVELSALPALGDQLPPLDDGRIEVSAPDRWYLPSRSSEYIVCFMQSRRASHPVIYITAEDYEPAFNVSEGTVGAFAQQRAAALQAAGKTLSKEVTPLRIGPHWGVAYMSRGKSGNNTVELMFFETVVEGRKFTYEMRLLSGTLDTFRPQFFAVIGRTNFTKAGATAPAIAELTPAEPAAGPAEPAPAKPAAPAAEKPAAEKPAAEKPAAPVTEKPAAEKPAAEKPAAPAAEKPPAEKPAAPAAEKPAAEKPAAEEPEKPAPRPAKPKKKSSAIEEIPDKL
jgi:hypothetical protein